MDDFKREVLACQSQDELVEVLETYGIGSLDLDSLVEEEAEENDQKSKTEINDLGTEAQLDFLVEVIGFELTKKKIVDNF